MRIQRNIQRWGDEENPVALRLQTRCLEGCEIPQPKARDHAALIHNRAARAVSGDRGAHCQKRLMKEGKDMELLKTRRTTASPHVR
jgi:hypothetical protein